MRLNNNIAHYGDIMAIPFFLITFIYFYNMENKTVLENLIMFFIFVCLIGDIFFSAIYFKLL